MISFRLGGKFLEVIMEGFWGLVLMVALLYLAVKLPSDRELGERSRNRRGQKAYLRGDRSTARYEWESLAREGNAEAQCNLGNMYANGTGVSQDVEKAYKLFSVAIAQGHEEASMMRENLSERMSPDEITNTQFSLGMMYRRGDNMYGVSQDFLEAVKWFHLAAGGGHTLAQCELAQMYYNGEGVPQDYGQAAKCYHQAAEAGDTDAQYNLGKMYAEGKGVRKNQARAAKWIRKAAEVGDAEAENDLGLMYAKGIGVTQDYEEAVEWFQRAWESGLLVAQYNLGFMHQNGCGIFQSYKEAMECYRYAARVDDDESYYAEEEVDEARIAFARNKLGEMYYQGNGVPRNYEKAFEWFEKAAESEKNALAEYNLGGMYAEGKGVEKDYEAAWACYCSAAEKRLAGAQYNLGLMHDKDYDVPQNIIATYAWLNASAARDEIAKRMSSKQITEAKSKAKQLLKQIEDDDWGTN